MLFEIFHFVEVEYFPIILLGVMIGIRGPDRSGQMLLYTLNCIGGVGWSVLLVKNSLDALSSPLCSADLHPDAAENFRKANYFFITCTQTNGFVLITLTIFILLKMQESPMRLDLVKSAMGLNFLYFIMNPNGLVVVRILFQSLFLILYRIESQADSFFAVIKSIMKDCWYGLFNVACITLLLFMPLIQGCFIDSSSSAFP